MTKKILLKWLEARKAEALAQVDAQETAAKAALLAEKLERTKFAEMVAYVEPRLTEVYNYMMDWHKKNEELAGPLSMSWGTILYSIHNVLLARVPMAEKLQETELREARVDRDLKKRFSDIRREVEKTYYNVALNVNALANAKLGLEYLSTLGFDLSGLTRTELQPSATLIRLLKQRKGFTNATRNNIRVYRSAAGYTIEMAGRNGAKAKSELIRLPGTK